MAVITKHNPLGKDKTRRPPRGRPPREGHDLDDDRIKLIEDNLGLVYYWSDIFVNKEKRIEKIYEEDLISYMMMNLVRAAQLYEYDQGEFTRYAGSCITFALKKFYEEYYKYNNFFITVPFGLPLDDESNDNWGLTQDVEDFSYKIKEQISWDDVVFLFNIPGITPLERDIMISRYKGGYTFPVIGKMLNYSGERIRQLHKNAIKNIQKYIEKNNITYEDIMCV